MEQERQRSESLLQEAVTRETERCEQLMKEQHERLSAGLEEDRSKNQGLVEEAIKVASTCTVGVVQCQDKVSSNVNGYKRWNEAMQHL